MSFVARLRERNPDPAGRRWVYVPYDQLSDRIGPLSRTDPRELGIVLIETPWKPAQRPYHRQKLALLLANQRHFALEQAARGVAVRYEIARQRVPYGEILARVEEEVGGLCMMEAAERELRGQIPGSVQVLPHEGWLTTEADFRKAVSRRKGQVIGWRMDRFYRHVRQRTGILMDGGAPVGGRYSFDGDNRERWDGTPDAPVTPTFPRDPIKDEVCDLVERFYVEHPGRLDRAQLPATPADAEALWSWAKAACMTHFGPYEDAMSRAERSLFHTRISPLLNLHRLLPRQVVDDVLALDIPLNSKEGFVRQVLGWREFVRHVHRGTDGFRWLPGRGAVDGDGPSVLGADNDLPPAFWPGAPSGLSCLDTVVDHVWATGWSHHIERLMVLGNIATLLDVSPRQLSDWFWVAYTDAYDWVVEPNVLGMATFGAGDVMTTKPYVSGAGYIHRMSDFCSGCRFDPKKDCPLTRLYWAFLARHEAALADNQRLGLVLGSLGRRSPEQRARDAEVYQGVWGALSQGAQIAS